MNNKHSVENSDERKVLIIEDERKTSEGWVQELSDRGIEADVATNPDEANEKLRAHRYQVIVLDLMLPQGSKSVFGTETSRYDVGVEILRSIRDGEFGPSSTTHDVPVIIVTAVTEASVMEKIRCLNAERIYTKPESPRVVAEHVKILLEEKERHDS